MRTETLHEFVVLAKHLSFTAAAKELFLSQPALSTHIARLEKELGFTLLARTGSQLYLTQAGAVFLSSTQKMLKILDKGLVESRAVATELPPVSIAGLSLDSPYCRALMQIKDLPFVYVDINEDITLLKALELRTIDIGLHFDYSNIPTIRDEAEAHGIAFMPCGFDRLAISVMKSHPLAARTELRHKDLRGLKITITSGAHYDTWKLLVLETLGTDLELEFNLHQLRSMRNLTFLDLGDSAHVCSIGVAAPCFGRRSDVVNFEQVDDKDLLYPEGFIYRENNLQAKALLENLRTQLEEVA